MINNEQKVSNDENFVCSNFDSYFSIEIYLSFTNLYIGSLKKYTAKDSKFEYLDYFGKWWNLDWDSMVLLKIQKMLKQGNSTCQIKKTQSNCFSRF